MVGMRLRKYASTIVLNPASCDRMASRDANIAARGDNIVGRRCFIGGMKG
jgi:hypothetical protein